MVIPVTQPTVPTVGNAWNPALAGYGINPYATLPGMDELSIASMAGPTQLGANLIPLAQGTYQTDPYKSHLTALAVKEGLQGVGAGSLLQHVVPGWNEVQPQGLGEQLLGGTANLAGAIGPIMGIEGAIAKTVPALGSSALLPTLGRQAVTGALYGTGSEIGMGPKEAIGAGLNAAWQFPAFGLAGRIGSKLATAALPKIPSEIRSTFDVKGQHVETELMGNGKHDIRLDFTPAEALRAKASAVGEAVGGALAGYGLSKGDISQAILGGAMGLLGGGHEGAKNTWVKLNAEGKPDSFGVGKEVGKNVTVPGKDVEAKGIAPKSSEGGPTTVEPDKFSVKAIDKDMSQSKGAKSTEMKPAEMVQEALAKEKPVEQPLPTTTEKIEEAVSKLAEDKYIDLKAREREAKVELNWNKFTKYENLNPLDPNYKLARDSYFLHEDALLNGDLAMANAYKEAAAMHLEKVIQEPVEGKQTLPPELRQYQAEQKAGKSLVGAPEAVFRMEARRQAIQELCERDVGIREPNPVIDAWIAEQIKNGNYEASRFNKVDPRTKMELLPTLENIVKKAVAISRASLSVLEAPRIFEELDGTMQGTHGGVGPLLQKLYQDHMSNRLEQLEKTNKLWDGVEEALNKVGIKTQGPFGMQSFVQKGLERLSWYRMSKLTDDQLINDKKLTKQQIIDLRKEVKTYSPEETVKFDRAIPILNDALFKIYPEAYSHFLKSGKLVGFETDFIPFMRQYASIMDLAGSRAVPFFDKGKFTNPEAMPWHHVNAKTGLPTDMMDIVSATKRYIYQTYASIHQDVIVQRARWVADYFNKAGRTDLGTYMDKYADGLVGMEAKSNFDNLVSPDTPIGKFLNVISQNFVSNVVMSFGPALMQTLNIAYGVGAEGGGMNFIRHLGKVLAEGQDFAKQYSVLHNIRNLEDTSQLRRPNSIQKFFSDVFFHTDKIMIAASFNMAFEHATQRLGMDPKMAITYADMQAARINAVFAKTVKPMLLRGDFAKIFLPLQTSVFTGMNTLLHDSLLNKYQTKEQKISRVVGLLATTFMARLGMSLFRGTAGTPYEELEQSVLDYFPIIGSIQRYSGTGKTVMGTLSSITDLGKPSKAIQTGITYFAPPGSLAVYRLFDNMKTLMNDGKITDKNGRTIYQFNTQDPTEIMRALTFSPYGTWGISKQMGEKHPPFLKSLVEGKKA